MRLPSAAGVGIASDASLVLPSFDASGEGGMHRVEGRLRVLAYVRVVCGTLGGAPR